MIGQLPRDKVYIEFDLDEPADKYPWHSAWNIRIREVVNV